MDDDFYALMYRYSSMATYPVLLLISVYRYKLALTGTGFNLLCFNLIVHFYRQ